MLGKYTIFLKNRFTFDERNDFQNNSDEEYKREKAEP